jgi:hypothetical protein
VKGFIGTWANLAADVNFVIQIVMGLALIFGAILARAKRYVAHGVCQAAVLVLNLVMIALVMWPTFHAQVLVHLPMRIAKQHYAIATAHGILGAGAELLGIYILLVAGTDILPHAWRFRRWKLWMRIELALWWAVLLTGSWTYGSWYTAASSH